MMSAMETPAVAGRSQGGKTRAVDNRTKKKDQYGSYYDCDLELDDEEEETEAQSEARIRAKSRASFEARLLGTATGNDPASSDEEEEFECTPHDPEEESPAPAADGEEFQTQRGACESVFLWMKRSQPCLIAMCQGLMARPNEVYPGTYVFDMDRDEILKAFPQKTLFFPTVKVLKEEAQRRATLFKLKKPLKKSANRTELVDWLKCHEITDPLDEAFLRFEANKTYQMIMKQAEEAAAVSRERLASRNWNSQEPWMRFYHCVTDDEVKVLLRTNERTLTREELDARNSSERPPTCWEKIAELYNSDKCYISCALPDLHSSFGEPKVLLFDDMPGGPITAEDAKTRLSDARAKMISIIKDCERSGNGFGQRDVSDDSFGEFDPEAFDTTRGDERSAFVKPHLGQRFHHLYFWHLCETMGVLKTVLNVLSPEVSGDTDSVPGSTTSTQKKRRGSVPSDDDEERVAKKKFREGVQLSLKSIGDGLTYGNILQAIVTTRHAIRAEEDKVMAIKVRCIVCSTEEKELYESLSDHHQSRVAEYEEELAALLVEKKERHAGK
jgi:hypothetical protein